MHNQYNLYNLEASFKQFLLAGNVSPITLKNYLSDYRHFIGWSQSITSEVEHMDIKLIQQYKNYLISNNLPIKTVNRRLSTVRKFCSFCISQGWMKENPAKKITNFQTPKPNRHLNPDLTSILDNYNNYLTSQNHDTQFIKSSLDNIQELLQII